MREQFANLCHEQWSGWLKYMFSMGKLNEDGSLTITKEFVDRWTRQMNTPYKELSEAEQDSDRAEAAKFIALWRAMEQAMRNP